MLPVLVFWLGWLWKAFCTMPDFLGNNWTGALFAFIFAFLYERRKLFDSPGYVAASSLQGRLRASGSFLVGHWKGTVKLWAWLFLAFLLGHTLDLVFHHDDSLASANVALHRDLENKPSDLSVRITMRADGNRNGHYMVAIAVLVTNPSGPPRSLSDWSIDVSSGGKTLHGNTMLLPDLGPNFGSKSGFISLSPSTYCPRSFQELIPAGGTRECWMWSGFYTKYEDVRKNPKNPIATIKFHDVVTGKDFAIPAEIPKGVNGLL